MQKNVVFLLSKCLVFRRVKHGRSDLRRISFANQEMVPKKVLVYKMLIFTRLGKIAKNDKKWVFIRIKFRIMQK